MKTPYLFFLLLIPFAVGAQQLSGNLIEHPYQDLKLEGFDGFDTIELAKTRTDSLGNFSFQPFKPYRGMAFLKAQDQSNLVLLLSGDPLYLSGSHLSAVNDLQLSEGETNDFFNYAIAQQQRKNALRAWTYLDEMYTTQKTFAAKENYSALIAAEIKDLKAQERIQIAQLAPQSYLRWFIPYRSFIQDLPTIIRTETERIPESISLFRTTDFNHPNWKTSGILQEFIEKHYFMLENSSGTEKEKQAKMNKSSSYLVENLRNNPFLLDRVVAQLFTYLEDRSLFYAAEFLASQVLNDAQCEIEETTAKKLEKYRRLKVGVKAPDIQLYDGQKLSDFHSPILLIFGKSDCPYCQKEAIELLKYSHLWKTQKRLEVVYVSLDTDKKAYETAYQNAPWHMFCDFKGWKSQAAKDYFIWGTPSYFLLDKDLTVLSHINSVAHANAWINQRL